LGHQREAGAVAVCQEIKVYNIPNDDKGRESYTNTNLLFTKERNKTEK